MNLFNEIELDAERPTNGKSDTLEGQLRDMILSGKLAPNAKLATFNQLEKNYGVSRSVVREALYRLKNQGFIYTQTRKGIFINPHPPHLSHYALMFAGHPSDETWPRMYVSLEKEIGRLTQASQGRIRFTFYTNLSQGSQSADYQRLLQDVRQQRLAGLLWTPGTEAIAHKNPFASCQIPHVFICGAWTEGHTPSVTVDSEGFTKRISQWMEQKNLKKVALLGMANNLSSQKRAFLLENLPTQPHWIQGLSRHNVSVARFTAHLLVDYPADQRPDTFIIADDNLTEHAMAGLLDAQLIIGRDIQVIAHCNWPGLVPAAAPLVRLGFHSRDILNRSLEVLQQQRQYETPADYALVPALFEDEITEEANPYHTVPSSQPVMAEII